ncbi:Ger(x)C family spore germination protein [Ammoniphilus sp. YIM 78166]|uniref:Ger(x)C family spore germination protein n=1 Tax=Ammoniphilus sp. YIM 78166 TaxID=1644106 RepID=UPI00107019BA|nr:Ger(x)C family spore germination protein [Ammoniphilus sp. YIM 78166]
MVHTLRILLVINFVFMFLTGCTDAKRIEDLHYVTALGIDHKGDKYKVYAQSLSFSSVAKSEGSSKEPTLVTVGLGEGKSLEEAIFDVYQTAQERIFWAHMEAIVLSESVLKKGDFPKIHDSLVRYHEFRMTPWVFGTVEPMEEILTTKGFFGQSPLSTLLHEPLSTYEQASLIRPIQLYQAARELYEPGFTLSIPSLGIKEKSWEQDGKSDPKLYINGAFFLQKQSYKSFLTMEEIEGLRWIRPGTVRVGIPVPSLSDPAVQVVLDQPKYEFTLLDQKDKPTYQIQIKGNGYIVNRSENELLKLEKLTEKTADTIKKEIETLFEKAVETRTDLFNLEHDLYRNHFQVWKTTSSPQRVLLQEGTLAKIDVDLDIAHAASIKNKRVKNSNLVNGRDR